MKVVKISPISDETAVFPRVMREGRARAVLGMEADLGALLGRGVLVGLLPAGELVSALLGEVGDVAHAVGLVLTVHAVVVAVADEAGEDALAGLALEVLLGGAAGDDVRGLAEGVGGDREAGSVK